MTSPTFIVERDFGKIGREWIGHPEDTRSKIVDFVAFEAPDAVSIIALYREDDGRITVENVTEEILAEAEDMRADSSLFGVGS